MKILHSALLKKISSGIGSQMLNESEMAKKLNIDFEVKVFSPAHVIPLDYKSLVEFYRPSYKNKVLNWIEHRRMYYKWLKKQEAIVDCYLLRYNVGDPFQYFFISKCKKPVCLVHHTKELDEMHIYGLKGIVLKYIDKVFGSMSIRSSSLIIGVTNEIVEYEKNRIRDFSKKSIVYPNGIKIDLEVPIDERYTEIPELLFVASYFYDWHGLDLLIEQVDISNENFIIHIVGSLNKQDYQRIINNDKFIYHGILSSIEISTLAKQCWVGLGSFALYRKNMNEACTLKVREYLMMGLPVYSGHKDVFPDNSYFYKYEKLNLSCLLEFALESRSWSKQSIKSSSINYISKENIVNNLNKELLDQLL